LTISLEGVVILLAAAAAQRIIELTLSSRGEMDKTEARADEKI
jgi:hypothetical protein